MGKNIGIIILTKLRIVEVAEVNQNLRFLMSPNALDMEVICVLTLCKPHGFEQDDFEEISPTPWNQSAT